MRDMKIFTNDHDDNIVVVTPRGFFQSLVVHAAARLKAVAAKKPHTTAIQRSLTGIVDFIPEDEMGITLKRSGTVNNHGVLVGILEHADLVFNVVRSVVEGTNPFFQPDKKQVEFIVEALDEFQGWIEKLRLEMNWGTDKGGTDYRKYNEKFLQMMCAK